MFGVAHGAIHQRGCNRGVYAARECADRPAAAYSLAHTGDGRVNEMLRSPCGLSPANHQRKVAQDVGAVLRVVDLWVKLHRPHLLFFVLDSGQRVG